MDDRVKIVSVETLAKHWGTLTRATIDYRRADGSNQRFDRENYDHGNAAAMLLHNVARDTVLLVRQFRYPPTVNGDPGFILEVCAGLLDGDGPAEAIAREAMEETGHAPRHVRFVCDVYMSPGSVQEKLSLYIGEYDETTLQGQGGGLVAEGEEIELVELSRDDAMAMIADGRIVDGKTVILLQHLALMRP
jgi:nudix-type nucleoside diphosphatase (YffH/AdpP family)